MADVIEYAPGYRLYIWKDDDGMWCAAWGERELTDNAPRTFYVSETAWSAKYTRRGGVFTNENRQVAMWAAINYYHDAIVCDRDQVDPLWYEYMFGGE